MADATNDVRATGRRKTSIAKVRLRRGNGAFTVNGRPIDEYFTTRDTRHSVRQPLALCEVAEKFDVTTNVLGGGPQGQADAIRHGVARALVREDAENLPKLREAGFLTRDSRKKERKKYGQRGARARFQFSKR